MPDSLNDRATSAAPEPAGNPFGSTSPRTSTLRLIVIATILGAAAIATWWWSRRTERADVVASPAQGAANEAAPAAPDGQPVSLDARAARRIGVTYAAVEVGTMSSEIRTVALVAYDETRVTTISPKIDGWVEELFVNFTGQRVSLGQPLLTIYAPMLVTAQQELLLAGRLRGAVADAESDARQGVSELREAARRRLRYWDISDAQIERLESSGEVTKTMTLRSAVSGTIVQKNVVGGQRIMAGETLYQVADLSVVWLEGEVFERDLSSVRLGMRVVIDFDAFPGATRTGSIAYIYPTLNPDTRTARIRVELSNRDMRLKPGMYGTIRITSRSLQPTLLVPRSAVLSTGERHLVFVRRADGMLEPRSVTTGNSTDQQTQILTGVSVGDTIVSSATFLVDAESNLGSALGGMGGMPGMDMAPPKPKSAGASKNSVVPPKSSAPPRPDASMPGMNHAGREG